MIVLGIETSASIGTVALTDGGGRVLAECTFTAGLVHGVELLPAIDRVVARSDINRASIELIAVGRGPGSYTGTRVGIAAAKTLAWALGRPVVGVISLDSIAANASVGQAFSLPVHEQPGKAAPHSRPEGPARIAGRRVHAVIDARRQRVYTRSYQCADSRLQPLTAPAVLPAGQAAERILPGDAVLGDAIAKYADVFNSTPGELLDESLWQSRAVTVCRLGIDQFNATGPDGIHELAPLYLHRPEAEELWEKRHGGRDKTMG